MLPHSFLPATETGPIATARSAVSNCRAALVPVPFPVVDDDASLHEAQEERPPKLTIPWHFPLYFPPSYFPRNLQLLPPHSPPSYTSLFSELFSACVAVSLSLVSLSLYHDGLPLRIACQPATPVYVPKNLFYLGLLSSVISSLIVVLTTWFYKPLPSV